MITWIQTVLQKHHKSVFSVLLVAIIIAFVFTIGQVPFLGDRNRAWDNQKDFYGFDLSNEGVVQRLQICVIYEAILERVQPTEELVMRQAYLRHVANVLGLRGVSEQELTDYIQSAPAFQNSSGNFNDSAWRKFVSERVASGRMTEADLTSILSQNALVKKVADIIGGPGYIFNSDILRQYNQIYGKWNFDIAVFSYASFNPQIKVSDEILEKYFKANIENYRVGEGVKLEAVFFPSKDFASKVSAPSDSDITAHYGANMSKYAVMKDGKPRTPALSEIKDKVRADLLSEAALRKAAQQAEEFVMKIYQSGAKKASAELRKVVSDIKAEVKRLDPIRTTDTRLPDGLPPEVAGAGLKLDEVSFYSDPIPADNGFWVVILDEKLQSFVPKFADVKADVAADYTAAEKERLFAEKGKAAVESIRAAVKAKKPFADAARASGATVENVKDFSLANPPMSNRSVMEAYRVIASALPKMNVGGVSNMQTSGDSGYIFMLEKFTPPADGAGVENFKLVAENIKRAYAAVSSGMLVRDMIEKASAEKPASAQ